MKMKLTNCIVAGMLVASAGFANAAPVALSDAQMDGVSAGATAIGVAGAISLGDMISVTGAYTNTVALDNTFASAHAISGAIASSVWFGPAVAASSASAVATLP